MKQAGIKLELIICKEKGHLTTEEFDEVYDALIDLIDSKGWLVGGGYKVIDVNED